MSITVWRGSPRRVALLVSAAFLFAMLAETSSAQRGGAGHVKVTVTPRVVTDTSTITASFRAPYRLRKGHKWGLWLNAYGCNPPMHPDLAKGGWFFRRSVAPGKKVTATFTPSAPGVLGMGSTRSRTGKKWCWGAATMMVLDVTMAAREPGDVGTKNFRIQASSG